MTAVWKWAQGLLRPHATLVDAGAAYAQHLARNPDLVEAMGARSRSGFALKTRLADGELGDAVVRLVRVLGETSRQPLVLQCPSPLRWLALAQAATGHPEVSGLGPDHGESAAMYVADWLRRFGELPVTLLLLDGRRADGPGLSDLVADDLATYSPVVNAAEHYRWGLALRTDGELELHGSDAAGSVLPPSFWVDQPAPQGRVWLAEVPADAEPELVLARLACLG